MDHYMLLSMYHVFSIITGYLRDIFINLSQFIEKHVTVEFLIYFIFLPIAIIPSILIHHSGH
jgi:exosortase/archaeosortase